MTIDLNDDLLQALERYCRATDRHLSPEDAVHAILREWLGAHGYLAHTQEGVRPDDLSSANDG